MTCAEGLAKALVPLVGGNCIQFGLSVDTFKCIAEYLFDNKSGDKSYSTYCLNCICNALELIPNLPAFVKQGLNLLCSLIPSPVSLISGKFFLPLNTIISRFSKLYEHLERVIDRLQFEVSQEEFEKGREPEMLFFRSPERKFHIKYVALQIQTSNSVW